jgi:hypothetical protein
LSQEEVLLVVGHVKLDGLLVSIQIGHDSPAMLGLISCPSERAGH